MEGFCNFRALPLPPSPLRNHDRGRGRRSHNASVGQKTLATISGSGKATALRLRLGMGLASRLGWALRLAAATKGALISPTNVKNCGYADEQAAISGVVFVVAAVAAVEKCKFHFCFAFSHCFYSSLNNF